MKPLIAEYPHKPHPLLAEAFQLPHLSVHQRKVVSGCVADRQSLLHSLLSTPPVVHAGQALWRQTFGSPVAALYIWSEGRLQQLPITAVARGALKHISSSTALAVRTRSTLIEAQDQFLQ